MSDPLYRVGDAAAYTGLSREWFRSHALCSEDERDAEHYFPAVMIGRQLRFRQSDLDTLVHEGTAPFRKQRPVYRKSTLSDHEREFRAQVRAAREKVRARQAAQHAGENL